MKTLSRIACVLLAGLVLAWFPPLAGTLAGTVVLCVSGLGAVALGIVMIVAAVRW